MYPSVKLNDLVTINPSWQRARLPGETPVAFTSLAALDDDADEMTFIERQLDAIPPSMRHFRHGDILIPGVLTALRTGRMAQARITQEHGFCPPNLFVVRPDASRLDGRFLFYFLRQAPLPTWIAAYLSEDSAPSTSLSFLKSLTVTLPPLAEQQRLADQMDRRLNTCRQQRQAIASLEQEQQSYFMKLLGVDPNAPHKTAMATVGDLLDDLICGVGGWLSYRADHGERLYQCCHLGRNCLIPGKPAYVQVDTAVPHSARMRVMAGDVLLAMRDKMGGVAVVSADSAAGYIDHNVAILRTRRIEPTILAAYLASDAGIGEMQRNGRTFLGAGAIRALPMPLPSQAQQNDYLSSMKEFARRQNMASAQLAQDELHLAQLMRTVFGTGRDWPGDASTTPAASRHRLFRRTQSDRSREPPNGSGCKLT